MVHLYMEAEMEVTRERALDVFDDSAKILRRLRYAVYSGNEKSFYETLDKLRLAVASFDWPVNMSDGHYPLIIVTSFNLVPLHIQAIADGYNLTNLENLSDAKISASIYCVLDVSNGASHRGENEAEAIARTRSAEMVPLTAEQGVALGTCFLESTSCNYHAVLAGSIYNDQWKGELMPVLMRGDGHCPMLKLIQPGKPGHKHFGYASHKSGLVITPLM